MIKEEKNDHKQSGELSGSIKLSERLGLVAALAGDGIDTLADVGCDHGMLGIHLALEGRTGRVIAMDLRKGPLSRAQANAAQYGLTEEKFETRLSDGLDELKPGEADVIVMAGIGGVLMCRLIARGIAAAKKAERLVLSPQSHIDSVRELLASEGFVITDEEICRESGKYYTVMCVSFSERPENGEGSGTLNKTAYALSDEETFFGPVLIKKGEPLFYEYVREMRDKAGKRLSQIGRKKFAVPEEETAGARQVCRPSFGPGIEPGAAHEDGYDPAEHFEKLLASAEKVLNGRTNPG
ncbi:MAG: class I SAM-dependent methyltransferase [Lachnospiraceae bacterium]|nr:class I SAM-dependent methyltransferase [Lachnospiraceae bacterium]